MAEQRGAQQWQWQEDLEAAIADQRAAQAAVDARGAAMLVGAHNRAARKERARLRTANEDVMNIRLRIVMGVLLPKEAADPSSALHGELMRRGMQEFCVGLGCGAEATQAADVDGTRDPLQ